MGCCNDIIEPSDINEGNDLKGGTEIRKVENNQEPQAKRDAELVKKKSSLNRARTNAEDIDLETFISEMVKLHNELRIKHDSLPLNENEELNNMASSYAKSLANNQEKNNCEYNVYKEEILGENIFITDYKKPKDIFKKISNEKYEYDFDKNKYSNSSAHFTQAIWKDTTDIGCGFWADKTSKKNFIVLLYYPAGNVLGNFNINVNKEKK